MLGFLGSDVHDPYVAAGLEYLRRAQTPSGAWFGRWGVNYIYGTWCVVSALSALRAGASIIERAAAWVLAVQNLDGGWGETCYSYHDASFAGLGRSTASQTAWAVLSLQLAGRGADAACQRGLGFLRDTQANGTWDEPEYTGTGFPRDFYINYHLYRHLFPTLALAGDRVHPEGDQPHQSRVDPMPVPPQTEC
jgi:squalene-hopene/tetraprenyl-beta-curcumene cyclase